jgi:integrator complex subunit 1
MERNRSKPKIGLHNSEIFALGKSSDGKIAERKRDIASTSLGVSSKKPKLSTNVPKIETPPSQSSVEYWEEIAVECDSNELVNSVLTATDKQDSDKILGLICGAVKTMTTAKGKSDQPLMLSLLYLAKVRPHIFCNEVITSALTSVLKKEASHTFKSKINNNICVMATNLLARGYHDKKQWPEAFLRLYIEDAINERTWVDNEECSYFIDNITYGFGTKTPPKFLLQQDFLAGVGGSMQKDNSPSVSNSVDDEASTDSLASHESLKLCEETVSRYLYMQDAVEKIVVESIKEQFNRRQPDLMTRNFLKFICTVSGMGEVGHLFIYKLWFF